MQFGLFRCYHGSAKGDVGCRTVSAVWRPFHSGASYEEPVSMKRGGGGRLLIKPSASSWREANSKVITIEFSTLGSNVARDARQGASGCCVVLLHDPTACCCSK